MERTVLLRHELADGSWHYDWLLERPAGEGLIAFRVADRIDEGAGSWEAKRIADHRPLYLDYEGEVPGGRGTVCRVAAGECRVEEEEAGRLVARVALGVLVGVVVGERVEGAAWRFDCRIGPL